MYRDILHINTYTHVKKTCKMNTGHYFHVQKINVLGMTTIDIFNRLQNHHPQKKVQKLDVHMGIDDACHFVIN